MAFNNLKHQSGEQDADLGDDVTANCKWRSERDAVTFKVREMLLHDAVAAVTWLSIIV